MVRTKAGRTLVSFAVAAVMVVTLRYCRSAGSCRCGRRTWRGDGSAVSLDGDKDEFGHARLGGIGNVLAKELEKRTGFETRTVVLGHIQRGGTPTAFDRVLATRYGLGAIDMVHRGEFGRMAALRGNKIISIPLEEAISKNRTVDQEMMDVASGILERLDDDKVSDEKEMAQK